MLTLVTGIEGFTGHYVKKELEANGHTAVGLRSDLTDLDAVDKEILSLQPEAVIHLAGLAFVGDDNANAFYDVNLVGTRNLLQALAKHASRLSSVLVTSSANVYGNSTGGVLDESMRPNPSNDYAVSKLAMEYMTRLFNNKLPLCLVRPFNYTGIGQNEKFLIPKIVKHFLDKEPVIELGNLDVWREFGDVRTVAKIYRMLVENCPAGETLNVCTGQTYSLKEVIQLCEKLTGHNIEIKVNPEFVRENEVRELKGDNTRLNRWLGNIPTYTFEETLNWMLDINKNN
ncbi:MAG: GDP-mannose 4,6-dehydratase [Gammaproteobacteria bacterium]|nr:GDP-mannose 4,6-dehydratase [Gammaproteobacteria bacterium]MCW9030348.1 GDP-mannose 4,6-dehydratase [Gammaproteobacteria bacterium]